MIYRGIIINSKSAFSRNYVKVAKIAKKPDL